MKICEYIEAHHEDFGAALFILPTLVVSLVLALLACELEKLLA